MVLSPIESLRAAAYECECVLKHANVTLNEARMLHMRAERDYFHAQRTLIAALEAEVVAPLNGKPHE